MNTLDKAFELLKYSRVDIVIGEYYNALSVASKLRLKDVQMADSPIATIPVYHFVHKKNVDLVSSIHKTLLEINVNELLEKNKKEVLKKFFEIK